MELTISRITRNLIPKYVVPLKKKSCSIIKKLGALTTFPTKDINIFYINIMFDKIYDGILKYFNRLKFRLYLMYFKFSIDLPLFLYFLYLCNQTIIITNNILIYFSNYLIIPILFNLSLSPPLSHA